MNIKKLIIGTANFGKSYGLLKTKINSENFLKISREYKRKKSKLLVDTATSYEGAYKILSKSQNFKLEIITKLPPLRKSLSILKVKKILNNELKKLKQKKFYAVLVHDTKILNTANGKILYEALLSLKRDKLIKKIGFSVYHSDELEKYYKIFKPEIVQIPVNLFNQEFVKNNWLKNMKKDGVEIHCRSIFLQGIILNNNRNFIKKNRQFKNHLNIFKKWLKKNKIDALKASLNFINRMKYIDRVLIGVENFRQFKEILEYKPNRYNLDFSTLSSTNKKLINPSKW